MCILRALVAVLFRPSTHQNWPRDRKSTQRCWCPRWYLGLRADVGKIHTRLVVKQVYIEKMSNKNIEIGFQSAVFLLCQRALVPLLRNDRGPNATAWCCQLSSQVGVNCLHFSITNGIAYNTSDDKVSHSQSLSFCLRYCFNYALQCSQWLSEWLPLRAYPRLECLESIHYSIL